MTKIHVQSVRRQWTCRRWSREAPSPSPFLRHYASQGMTVMLGRLEIAVWRGGIWSDRPWFERPRLWIGKGAGFTQVSWWHFTVHVEIDPISWSFE